MGEAKHALADTANSFPALGGGPLARWLAPSTESRVERIPVAGIEPRPIADHDEGDTASFAALLASIRARGIVEPLLLRPAAGGSFVVVCGARRLRAARKLGLETVPAIVRELGAVETLLTGAWQALLRFGVAPEDAVSLEQRLVAGGLEASEAAALVAAIPRRSTPSSAHADVAKDVFQGMRSLRPGGRRLGRRSTATAPGTWAAAAPDWLVIPHDRAALRALAMVSPPNPARHLAA